MNAFQRLTTLQQKVGYQEGILNPIAVLGLFGEAGEVLNELFFINTDDPTDRDLQMIHSVAVAIAALCDMHKKKIRDKGNKVSVAFRGSLIEIVDLKNPTPQNKVKVDKDFFQRFDTEVSDTLYYLNAIAIARGKTLEEYAEISYEKVSAKTQITVSQ